MIETLIKNALVYSGLNEKPQKKEAFRFEKVSVF